MAKDDPAPHRDEIRLKVSRAKSLKKEDRQKATALPTSLVVESSETNTSTSDSVSDTVLEDQPKADTDPKPAVKAPVSLKVKETKKDALDASENVIDRNSEIEKINALREETFDYGDLQLSQFQSLIERMKTVGFEMTDEDWILYTSFTALVLPIIGALGKNRSALFMKKLQSELKTDEPQNILNKVFPKEGNKPIKAPVKPKNWRV